MANSGFASRGRREAIVQRLVGNRRFAGTIVIDDQDGRSCDHHRIQDLVDEEFGGFKPGWRGYWTDGSVREDRLGASVVEIFGYTRSGSTWGIKERAKAWHLGRFSGKSGDAELYGIAAALGMALDEYHFSGWMHTVRVYTDAASVLRGIETSTGRVVGPITDDADPLAIQLVFDRAEVLYGFGVRVELHWVKGHEESYMNGRADRAARFAAVCPPPNTRSQPGQDCEIWPGVPQSIVDKGEDVLPSAHSTTHESLLDPRSTMTSFDAYTDKAARALADSFDLAKGYAHPQLTPIHLAVSLIDPPPDDQQKAGLSTPSVPFFRQVIDRANGDPQQLERSLKKALVRLPSQDPPPERTSPSPAMAKMLRAAEELARTQKDTYIAVEHLIQCLCQDPSIQKCLAESNVPNTKLVDQAIQAIRGTKRVDSKTADAEEENENLKKFTIDMTAMAREGKIDPVIGREEEIRRVIRILSRRTKNNPVLIGEPGVGKTTVVEGLARRIVDADVPANLAACKLLSLDVGALVAGSKYRGEFEERMKGVLKEVEESRDMIVLFVDEMHLLMGAGSSGEGGMDAANLLKPMLARGQLHCIGATTLSEYRKYIEKDQAFERRFQQVLVKEPSIPETISILRGLKERYETHHGVTIMDGAIVSAATLAARYLTQRRLPDSAVDLIDEAAAAVRVTRESQPEALDNMERRLRQLEIEIHALNREKDEASQARLKEARAEAANIEEELKPLREMYEREKGRSKEIQEAKIKLENLHNKVAEAERIRDLQTASDLTYYAIPDLKQRIAELEAEKKKADQEMWAHQDGGGEALLSDSVGPDQINEIVARWTGIPVTRLKTTEKDKLLNMERHLGRIVVGQKEAVGAVSNAIRLQRSGLANPNQPPSFLFCGPSGTGKTLLTKALAEFLFDDPKSMIRFDMSEYQERHSLSRMIGAPPGYVGHDAGGQLTEALRRRPFSILLFDEVEKAAKEVLTVLLQLMDDGRITDGQGRVVDAKNCVVVLTSNLGAEYLSRANAPDGRIDPTTREMVMGALRSYFLPEFLNRISSVVIFNRLTKKEIRKIVDVRMTEIQKRLMANGRNVRIEMTNEVRDYLGSAGYSPAYGARPLARLIEKEVLNRMAVMILRGSIKDGEAAHVVLEDGHIHVLPNHTDSEEDSEMYDESDAVAELEDDADGGMDLYE
ncbi:P-loop containing nucleoside triphosphate hydrolase protein [Karstenula rhodostoma CBS 690.94]|uniref:P-loop containing nucleoside triphosphate hydrolase protein n=1 Tax=Karstenula rhodostoma CBS 690.94 TaxID=1392251 RepID=A0A9P4UB60_9PLEO|nr:P-loop containing nucleoside triphosphate hydrolase protein [Karstenula rhodostoma CBS 690.94]